MRDDGFRRLQARLLLHAEVVARLEVAHEEVALRVELHQVQLEVVDLLRGEGLELLVRKELRVKCSLFSRLLIHALHI